MKTRYPLSWCLLALLTVPSIAQEDPGLRPLDPSAAPESAARVRAIDALGLGPADRTRLREALQQARHGIRRGEAGHTALCPSQGWSLAFDGRGITAGPPNGPWSWGLELESYGFEGAQQSVLEPIATRSEGPRLTYVWDDLLQEWYVNGAQGVEHGFTLERRPEGGALPAGEATLVLRLGIRGELVPSLHADGRGVSFTDAAGQVCLVYSGLVVFDADGVTLPAQLESDAQGLTLRVEESGARYPLTIDPTAQQAYLKASNAEAGDDFGVAVSLSGNSVAIGADLEDSNATGVNGSGANNLTNHSGAVYVFVRNGVTWSQEAYIKASNPDAQDLFGISVSLSGDTLVVGSPEEDSNATGVNGDQANNSGTASGAAYVFARTGTTWTQQAYLKASNAEAGDGFGHVVSVSGDHLVVGAPFEASAATGVNGDPASNAKKRSGAAYVFVRNGTSWSQEAYLKASNTDKADAFAASVTISGDTVVVGAAGEDSHAVGIGGDESDNSSFSSGASYVFVRSGTLWSQQAYLKSSNSEGNDQFGAAVALADDTLVISATYEDSSSTGANGDETDNSTLESGAAYVFVRSGTSWSQEAYLKSSNPDQGDGFGESLAVHADSIVVGTSIEASASAGVNGDQLDNSCVWAGAAYLFKRVGTTWSQTSYLKASNPGSVDVFGLGVGLWGSTVLIGAPGEDGDSRLINGPQNNRAINAGAAYVFEPPVAAATFRNALPNPASYSSTAPILGSTWTASVDLTTSGHTTALLIGHTAPALSTLAGGQVVLVGGSRVFQLPAKSGPLASWSVALPSEASFGGLTLYTQALHFGGVAPFALSNAQDLLIGY